MKRILFSSYHNYLDQGSGAAISVRSVLRLLANKDWNVRTLTGSYFDDFNYARKDFRANLERRHIRPVAKKIKSLVGVREVSFDLIQFDDENISSTVFLAEDAFGSSRPRNVLSKESEKIFLKLFLDELRTFQPDVYLTYGGYPTALAAALIARRMNVKNVFYLCNLGYNNKRLFDEFDAFIVPSRFSRDYYKRLLNIDCRVISPLIDESKVITANNSKRFLTFINPSPEKGLYFFLGIARELNRIRPDIPILIVEGRSKLTSKGFSQIEKPLTNLSVMENVTNPRLFYSQTRVLLVPSLCHETFCRVVVEAAMNKIPVICSNRGALPETATDLRYVLDIPNRFTPFSQTVPNQEEVSAWVEKIVELWDSPNLRVVIGERARKNSIRFLSEQTSKQVENFFLNLG